METKHPYGRRTACLALLLIPAIALGNTTSEPDWHHSGLCTVDGGVVWDSDLAGMISTNFTAWQDMKFVFGQCYSGGFVNDMLGLGDNIVVSTSSNWDRPAHYDGVTGESYLRKWNEAVAADATMEQAHDQAKTHSRVDDDQPQYASKPAALGDTLKLGQGQQSDHAVLFAGNVNDNPYSPIDERQMFLNDLTSIHSTLVDTYGYREDNVHVLFGDGSGAPWIDGAATAANLQAAIEAVGPLMNDQEEFFFWGFDHGTETKGTGPWVEISWVPWPWRPIDGDDDGDGPPDGPHVEPCTWIDLWAHVGWFGHEGELFHIDETSLMAMGGDVTIEMLAQPSEWHEVSEWFPWARVHIDDNPWCTRITLQADLVSEQLGGEVMWSNELGVHVVPEPLTMLGVFLGTGALGAYVRRRRAA